MRTGLPTEEGARRYPPEGFYISDSGSLMACLCKSTCRDECAGECGCKACNRGWIDYLRLADVDFSSQDDEWSKVPDPV